MGWWVAVYLSLVFIASGSKRLLSIAEIDLNVKSKVVGGITVLEYFKMIDGDPLKRPVGSPTG